ncbi:MAG: hypothetical protein ACRDGI_03465 [Candidatus Limnocylindrales bacterium]
MFIAIGIAGAGFALVLYVALPVLGQGWLGGDFVVYQDAARRFLAGGGFYPAYQTAGPFPFFPAHPVVPPTLLEPPPMLALFIPFLFLPTILWWAIPIAIVAVMVIYWRPKPWALAVIPLALIYQPTIGIVSQGNPALWLAAALALATRWPGLSVLIFLKPTLLPFALFGIRHRSWWIAAALLGLASLLLLPLDLDWIRSMLNAEGAGGALHSLYQVPLMCIPLVAWLGRTRRPAPIAEDGQLPDMGRAPS